MDFSLDMEIEDYCCFISVLYLKLYPSFNFYRFMFLINMDFVGIDVEMIGKAFYKVGY